MPKGFHNCLIQNNINAILLNCQGWDRIACGDQPSLNVKTVKCQKSSDFYMSLEKERAKVSKDDTMPWRRYKI